MEVTNKLVWTLALVWAAILSKSLEPALCGNAAQQ